MTRKPTRKKNAVLQNRSCDYQILKSRSPRFSTASPARTRSVAIAMPLTNSWTGTAQSHGCRSARLWSSATGCISSPVTSRQVQ